MSDPKTLESIADPDEADRRYTEAWHAGYLKGRGDKELERAVIDAAVAEHVVFVKLSGTSDASTYSGILHAWFDATAITHDAVESLLKARKEK